MRKLFFLLMVLILFLAGGVFCAAEDFSPLETPAPERYHPLPEPTPDPPTILDRTKDASILENVRFRLDATFLHIWFPIIANADEALITYGDEAWLIDCGDKGMGERGVKCSGISVSRRSTNFLIPIPITIISTASRSQTKPSPSKSS